MFDACLSGMLVQEELRQHLQVRPDARRKQHRSAVAEQCYDEGLKRAL